ncbi:MAG TPA: PilZ domain-containing protein [Gammaproteobacteria bacterium]|nr:PilZ domain-containing protein [Gammaproteobacteria bacterium]
MEHRFHPRRAIEIETVVFHRGVPAAICQTRDLSLGGAFVRTGPMSFYRHTPLEVELALDRGGLVEHHCLPAFVVRSDPQGVGLMFLNINSDARTAIRSALQAAGDESALRWAAPDTAPAVLLMGG